MVTGYEDGSFKASAKITRADERLDSRVF
ncbi:MAG: S-layer homology domain-containing protein [Firmicutes bacterium]|nr:S-layer homology domain-containing protein [Candidatus Fermentithermobacillaceae bacterium]